LRRLKGSSFVIHFAMSLPKTRLPLGTVLSFPSQLPPTENPPYQELEALEQFFRAISNELKHPTPAVGTMAESPTGRAPITPTTALGTSITAVATPVSASSAYSQSSGGLSPGIATPLNGGRGRATDSGSQPATPLTSVAPMSEERIGTRRAQDGTIGQSGETQRSAASGSREHSSRARKPVESEKSGRGDTRASEVKHVGREDRSDRSDADRKRSYVGDKDPQPLPVTRSAQQEIVRTVLLCMSSFNPLVLLVQADPTDLVPAVAVIPIALVLALTRVLLTPLYNSMPLSLHPHIVYLIYFLPPTFAYWRLTSRSSARELVSARVCLGISALGADLVAVGGRRTGSVLGQYLGAQWGALLSLGVLGVGVVGGGLCFALLCFVSCVYLFFRDLADG
jgi:hypothetical protein